MQDLSPGANKELSYGDGEESPKGLTLNLKCLALRIRVDPLLVTAMAGSDVVQSGRTIFDDLFQHLWPYIGNNTANVVFQMVKRL
ncbi:hypothetical protein TNCV_836411 [Trichonephila clavipes]|nr:hypothetical protein TNCV_836411 [Trichonephila clavipes]